MQGTGRIFNRFCRAAATKAGLSILVVATALLASAGPALAQDDAQEPDPAKAKELIQEATAAESNGDLEAAIKGYEQAYEVFPDPNLLIKLGDLQFQNLQLSDARATYKKYQEVAPPLCSQLDEQQCQANEANAAGACKVAAAAETPEDGEETPDADGDEADDGDEAGEDEDGFQCVPRYTDEVQNRLDKVDEQEKEQAEEEQKEAERIAREAEEKRLAEEKRKREEASKLPLALSAMVMVGADHRSSVFGRLLAGGMMRFGRFAPEAHIAFEGFLRPGEDGTQAQSFTVIDLGARYAFTNENFAGPYAGFGGGFGFFLGNPREVNLEDADSCAGQPGNRCTVDIDRHLNGRVGLGYGFASGEKATVAVRLDFHTFWYSVDDEQPDVSPAQVEKPLLSYAVTLGIEFLRWR